MSNFSTALNNFLTAAAGNPNLLNAAGGLFNQLGSQVSTSSTAVGQAKAMMQSMKLAVATNNVALVTALATSLLTTPGMPSDIQAMAQLVIEKASTPQVGQFVTLLENTIVGEQQSNNSILNTINQATSKLGG